MPRRSIPLFTFIASLSTVVFLLLQWFDPALLHDHLEGKTYDLRVRLRNLVNTPTPHKDIVIVDIDEKSLSEVGRWPWSRTDMAELVQVVAAGAPRVIGIDVFFSEAESSRADQALAQAIAAAGNVVLATPFLDGAGQAAGEPPSYDFLWDSAFAKVEVVSGIDWKAWAVKPARVLPPVGAIAQSGILGHVLMYPDLDGVLRWDLLYVYYQEDFYPSLPLQVARLALALPPEQMILYPGSSIDLGGRRIETDLSGRILIDYYGREGTFNRVSASDLLYGRIPSQRLQDAIVLIGTSAFATYDQKVTPVSADMSGVEKNANVVQNLLDADFLRRSPGIFELAAILFSGGLLLVLLPRQSARNGIILGFGLITFYFFFSFWLLIDRHYWLNLVYPVANMSIIVVLETAYKLFAAERKAREIRTMFSSYVSPKIVETLLKNPEKLALGGERRVATILFSDMIGFTSISEKLPPEAVVAMLNGYYKEMAEIIFHWDGTLDKFVGDEIMALWNAPLDQENHAELAVRCALHMSDRLDQLRVEWSAQGLDIDCGIGLNTGEVLIGNVGLLGKKMDYTAIGNHVNVAARLEKLTRTYQTRIIIGENTLAGISGLVDAGKFGHVAIKSLESVKVKGKDEAVNIFSLTTIPEASAPAKDGSSSPGH